jgi:hypothetical protein
MTWVKSPAKGPLRSAVRCRQPSDQENDHTHHLVPDLSFGWDKIIVPYAHILTDRQAE